MITFRRAEVGNGDIMKGNVDDLLNDNNISGHLLLILSLALDVHILVLTYDATSTSPYLQTYYDATEIPDRKAIMYNVGGHYKAIVTDPYNDESINNKITEIRVLAPSW
jgi:hypothetical protein